MVTSYYPSDPRTYLREELQDRKKRRPQYSLRAFARDLEVSPSYLCEFLAGRQGMSRDRVLWVGKKIHLTHEQVEHFWDLVESEFGRSQEERQAAQVRYKLRLQEDKNRLSPDEFYLISEWYHLTLLELLHLPNRDWSTSELANILGISLDEVEQALERLQKLKLLEVINGRYQVTSTETVTGDVGASHAIRKAHQQFLQMQAEAVEEKSMDDRESLSVSLSISNQDWPDMRRELKEAIVSIASRYVSSESEKNQVVCLAFQAIRLLHLRSDQ